MPTLVKKKLSPAKWLGLIPNLYWFLQFFFLNSEHFARDNRKHRCTKTKECTHFGCILHRPRFECNRGHKQGNSKANRSNETNYDQINQSHALRHTKAQWHRGQPAKDVNADWFAND